jgi:hypothetical protein
MPCRFEPGRICGMPTHFGPAPSPRQMLAEAAAALERHIPARFALGGDPVVTVEFYHMAGIDWLAGRGYTMIDVWWAGHVQGSAGSGRRPLFGSDVGKSR